MEFLGERGIFLAGRFLEWFKKLVLFSLRDFVPPRGYSISGATISGVLVLTIAELQTGQVIEVKLKPAVAYESLDQLPGCMIDLDALSKVTNVFQELLNRRL
jgi:hypothetical protein